MSARDHDAIAVIKRASRAELGRQLAAVGAAARRACDLGALARHHPYLLVGGASAVGMLAATILTPKPRADPPAAPRPVPAAPPGPVADPWPGLLLDAALMLWRTWRPAPPPAADDRQPPSAGAAQPAGGGCPPRDGA
jgi:hypothetical protein